MSVAARRPPLLERILRVGVTGHIHLGAYDRAALAAGVRSVLEQVRASLASVTDAPGLDLQRAPRLVVVSPLAAGADQLVAEEALALGFDLHVPLPFLREEVERDFDEDPSGRDGFRRLLARKSRVLELGAERGVPGSAARDQAYETVGWVVLSQCDLVIGVWDGQPASGSGGTGDVVALALEAGMPVIQIPPAAPAQARLCVGALEGTVCELTTEGVRAVVRRLLAPFGQDGAGSAAEPAEGERTLAGQRDQYAAFLAEEALGEHSGLRGREGQLLGGLWRRFLALGARREAVSVEHAPDPPAQDGVLEGQARWANELADRYQGLYRGAFLALYLLGALAVTLALLGLLGHVWGFPHGWGVSFAVLEVLTLSLVVLVYARARRGRWHAKGTSYRVLAELLRHGAALAPLGVAPPVLRPRAHLGGEADLTLTWMVAHCRAVVRERGLCDARFDARHLDATRARLAQHWLKGQAGYHRRVEAVFHRAGHRMESWSHGLFGGSVAACVLHFVLPGSWGPFFSILAAALPAWAAAFHGILGTADPLRLAERSRAMADRLDAAAAELSAVPTERLAWRTLADAARSVCADILTELDDWHALARHRDVRLP